jgi:hypothetical protein
MTNGRWDTPSTGLTLGLSMPGSLFRSSERLSLGALREVPRRVRRPLSLLVPELFFLIWSVCRHVVFVRPHSSTGRRGGHSVPCRAARGREFPGPLDNRGASVLPSWPSQTGAHERRELAHGCESDLQRFPDDVLTRANNHRLRAVIIVSDFDAMISNHWQNSF